MTINSEPTLKTHTLTTHEATNLIDWHYKYTPVKRYPLPTEIVLQPKSGYMTGRGNIQDYVEYGSIWPSLSTESEMVGAEDSSSRNSYWVAQVYENSGNDGHIKCTLCGWLHITTFQLRDLVYGTFPEVLAFDVIPLYKSLADLYQTIERGAPTNQ